MTDLQSLLDRVRKAEGADREIDGLLEENLGGESAWVWFARANTLDKLKARGGKTERVEVWLYFSDEGGGWWQWGAKGWRRGVESEETARKIAGGAPGPWFYKPEPDEIEIIREPSDKCPLYTASLDAALALTERVLPGLFPGVQQYPDGWGAEMVYPEPRRDRMGTHFAICSDHNRFPTPALALLAALLSAKIAEQSP